MRFISWNIDSLNAALTATSARALLTRDVLSKIAAEDADIIAIQETKLPAAGMNKKQKDALAAYFPDYDIAWVSSCEPARKGYAGTMALYKKGLEVKADFPKIGAPEPMDCEGRTITLELGVRFLTDWLDGDKYFATKYPGHNLDRCRSQLALALDMEIKREEMKEIVNELSGH